MITCSQTGDIVVNIGNRSYNLSVSEQYVEFLLWITSPDPAVVIDESLFAVDDGVPEGDRAKADRYASFLIEFCRKRTAKLAAMGDGLSIGQRETEIEAFLERLKDDRP